MQLFQGYYLRCTCVSICVFLNCVYLHLWSCTLWLWCIHLIAFKKNNIFHKETLKQDIYVYIFNKILHRNCMELDAQEFLNKNLPLLIDGNFEHIVGWKVAHSWVTSMCLKCNLFISGSEGFAKKNAIHLTIFSAAHNIPLPLIYHIISYYSISYYYIISYHIISYHIIVYHMISYYIIIVYHIIILYHIILNYIIFSNIILY